MWSLSSTGVLSQASAKAEVSGTFGTRYIVSDAQSCVEYGHLIVTVCFRVWTSSMSSMSMLISSELECQSMESLRGSAMIRLTGCSQTTQIFDPVLSIIGVYNRSGKASLLPRSAVDCGISTDIEVLFLLFEVALWSCWYAEMYAGGANPTQA
ncbi:hypothetical protein BDV95DRAFT_562414 [Massariosphaeria phaeospora]|uniref:Uncharacterized protein n=1 Tax=Massariosphaeria phaeospora TaxID=100035 RepID=A0A7C8MG09_9PLEO|nr:hypothetical protein BDV95DRAFT_562414 [Massariosphaeria phaeospora]